jgi:5-methylcytosine-specific restriction endonuclease McrA
LMSLNWENSRGYRSLESTDSGPEPQLAAGGPSHSAQSQSARCPATVARSLVKVWNETARIVDPADRRGRMVQIPSTSSDASSAGPPSAIQTVWDGRQYTWDDWSQLVPHDDELVIRTRSNRLRVPEVIVLTSYDRLPASAVTFSRRNIFKRDRFTCQYCARQGRMALGVSTDSETRSLLEKSLGQRTGNAGPGSEELNVDHVIPRAQGGTSTWENCVLACIDCNARKADRTPEQARMPLRRKPVRPVWQPLYGSHELRIDSWSKFVSEAYWTVELKG